MRRRYHRLWGAVYPGAPCPALDPARIQAALDARLDAIPSERRRHMRQKIRLTVIAAAVAAALAGTALAAARLDLFSPFFRGDISALEERVRLVEGSLTDGRFTVRVEGVVADQYNAILGLSVRAETEQARAELAELKRSDLLRVLLRLRTGSGPAPLARELPQYGTEDTRYFTVRVSGLDRLGGAPLELSFADSPEGPALTVPVDPALESLSVDIPYAGTGEQVTRVSISPMSVEADVTYEGPVDKTVRPALYFRRDDGALNTLSQLLEGGSWNAIGRRDDPEEGPWVYHYTAALPELVSLLSVESVVADGVEYDLLHPGQSAPVEIDETPRPFRAAFLEVDDTFLSSAGEMCAALGAGLEEGEDTLTVTYRGREAVLRADSTDYTLDGRTQALSVPVLHRDGAWLVCMELWRQFGVFSEMDISPRGDARIPPEHWLVMP